MVANRYEQGADIGEHIGSNPLYGVHSQQQVVISCNMVADGVLWISPTTNAGKPHAPIIISIEWEQALVQESGQGAR